MSNPGPAITTGSNTPNLAMNQAIRLLAFQRGVNLNATGDQAAMPVINASTFSVSNVILTNASTSITSGVISGVYTGPAGAGTAVVTSGALSALSASTVVSQLTVASTAASTAKTIYLNIATAQGAAATADVYVYGYDFSAT